jgi:methyl-accepting chemotaxis protein
MLPLSAVTFQDGAGLGAIMGNVLGHLRLTFAIAAMAIGSIAIAVLAVLVGLFISLSNTASEDAAKQVASATRISAAILQVNLPSLEVVTDDNGNVAGLVMRSMPRFRTNDVIDTIAQVTGQDVAVYVYNIEASPDFLVGTTSLAWPDGERLLDMPITAGTPLFASMLANQSVRSEASIEGGTYFLSYQPIATADGTVIGALMVAVDRAPIEAVVGRTLTMLLAVGGCVLLVIGALAFLLSRQLTRPIPGLSAVMNAIADGDLDVEVPYKGRRNEIGAMAKAVEVFRSNGQRVAELGAETNRHLVEAADHTGQLNAISMSQLVTEFTLTGEVLAANQNFLDLVGYALDDVLGQPNALFLFNADPTTASYRQFWLDLAAGQFKAGEYRRRRSDGREVWIQSTFNPILGVDGVPYKIVQFATDVTARKRAVAAIGAGLEQLAEGDLTASIDTPFEPQFEDLRHALNGTASRFADVVGQLQQTSRALRLATGEILSGANDLSERTTRQAATIEETSAAMEQLAGDRGRKCQDGAKPPMARRNWRPRACRRASGVTMMAKPMRPWSGSPPRRQDLQYYRADRRYRLPDQSLGAQRLGRSGTGGRCRQGLCRGGGGSAAAGAIGGQRFVSTSRRWSSNRLPRSRAGKLGVQCRRAIGRHAGGGRSEYRHLRRHCPASREQAAAIDEVSTAVRALDEMTQHNAALVEEINAAIEQTEPRRPSSMRWLMCLCSARQASKGAGPPRIRPGAVLTRALACRSVVSNTGNGLTESSISMPISVQPRMTASAPRAARRSMAVI